jgi:dihydroorotase
MVARDIELAELTGGHLHVAHMSTARAVELVRQAKQRGVRVTAEVTPHHFLLTDEAVGLFDPGKRMMPPLREQEDVRMLIEAMADRTVDAVATDHAPHAPGDKDVPFEDAANGVVGVETALSALMVLVDAKALTMARAVELLTAGPASVLDLPGGTLAPGSPADVAIFDPAEDWHVGPESLNSKSKNSPFMGWKMKGKVRYTLVAGKVVHEP